MESEPAGVSWVWCFSREPRVFPVPFTVWTLVLVHLGPNGYLSLSDLRLSLVLGVFLKDPGSSCSLLRVSHEGSCELCHWPVAQGCVVPGPAVYLVPGRWWRWCWDLQDGSWDASSWWECAVPEPSWTGVRKPLGVSFDELSNCSVQALGEEENWNFVTFSLSQTSSSSLISSAYP